MTLKLDNFLSEINFNAEYREYKMTEVMKYDNDIKEKETNYNENNKKDTEEKFGYKWLQIGKIEDIKNVVDLDSISVEESCNSEDSKQPNVMNCIDDHRECVEVHSEDICSNNIMKVETVISEDVKINPDINGIKDQNIDTSAFKMDIEHELNYKWLEPGKIENVKEEANLDNRLRIVHFDEAVDMVKYAQDVTNKDNSEFSNSVRWYRCKFCRYRSKFEDRFKKHLENKHKEGPQRYRCHLCEFETVNKQYLKGHFKRKHDDNAQWYKCRLCDLETKQMHYLARHYKTKHFKDSEWHQCEYCAFKTKLKKSLKNHIEFKHDIVREEDKLHRCQFCEYRCKFKSFLRQHLKNEHGQNVECHEHHCQNCEFKTNVKANLLQHYATLHNQDSELT